MDSEPPNGAVDVSMDVGSIGGRPLPVETARKDDATGRPAGGLFQFAARQPAGVERLVVSGLVPQEHDYRLHKRVSIKNSGTLVPKCLLSLRS